jgi:hypothetical protein
MSNLVQTTQPRGMIPSESPDVWDCGQIIPATQPLAVGTYYLGHVPRAFRPIGGVRLSLVDTTEGTIEYGISVGNQGKMLFTSGFKIWNAEPLVDSWVVPANEIDLWVQTYGLPAGAPMRIGISEISGVAYGTAFYGLRVQLLGYWEN